MNQPELKQIPINQIHAASNYRKTFNDKSLKELAQSIKENGVLEPIIVRPNNSGFQIVAGERRYRASKMAGIVAIPAVIRDVDDADILKLQIIENVQREGVQFMEEAYAIKKLRDDCTLDMKEIARMIGKSEAYVYYMLKLTSMSDDARVIAEKGWIGKGVAWQIAKLESKEQQTEAANALARTKRDKLVTESGAKHYIADNFGDSSRKMSKQRVKVYGTDEYKANWKHHLVRFDTDQFVDFKKIVRGRTETEVLAEAVDCVMRGADA
jgi:ParB family chromosome partitioning protein